MTQAENKADSPFSGYEIVFRGTEAVREPRGWRVTLPTKERFFLTLDQGADAAPWGEIVSKLGITGRLYLSTGHFLLVMPQGPERDLLIASFLPWVHAAVFPTHVNHHSWDHSTAMRIEAEVSLLQETSGGIREAVLRALLIDLDWACDPGNILLNNHGLFLLQALMFCRGMMAHDPKLFTELGGKERGDWIDATVHDRLPKILELVYGDDAWCGENSPMYDRVWINLINKLTRFFSEQLAEAKVLEFIQNLKGRADEHSRFLILPQGQYVPRGDTPRKQTGMRQMKGTRFSTRVGIWVHSSDDLYVLATCGQASLAHKHVDDTQLLLAYKMVDFFIDGGFHSYDYSDPRVLALRSGNAHSVLGLRESDWMTPHIAYANPPRQTARMVSASAEGAEMERVIDENQRLNRTVTLSANGLLVHDAWDLASAATAVSRFILPADCIVQFGPESIVLTRLGSCVTMTFDRPITASIVTGEHEPPHRGWYSAVANMLHSAICLEVSPVSSSLKGEVFYSLSFASAPEKAKG